MFIARGRSRFLGLVLLGIGLLAAPTRAAAPSPAYGTRGMVVASEAEAARAGRAMFERGGNAVDAAIATAFALAVTQPFSAGLGGGAFVLIRTGSRSEEHTSELQSLRHLVCRLLLEKKKYS